MSEKSDKKILEADINVSLRTKKAKGSINTYEEK